MSKKDEIKLKAKKDAPDFIQLGNLLIEKKDGYFYTEKREFADSIIADGYAEEVTVKSEDSKAAAVTVNKSKPTKPAKPKTTKPATETEKTDVPPVPPKTENLNEGETK